MARVRDLFAKTLIVIGEAMQAKKVAVSMGGAVDLGADHYARLTACKRLLELLTVGRPTPHPPDEKTGGHQITYEELERIVKENKAVGVGMTQ